MLNGMAGFLFEMRVEKGALDPGRYHEARKKRGRQLLTVEMITDKLDANGERELLYLAVLDTSAERFNLQHRRALQIQDLPP